MMLGTHKTASRSKSPKPRSFDHPTSSYTSLPTEVRIPESPSNTSTQLDQLDNDSHKRRASSPHINRQSRVSTAGPVDVDGTNVLIAVGRAILARVLFIVHSVATVWTTVNVQGNDSVWTFALISLLIILEGSYTIVMRAGDERKWFCTSVFLYILATAPPIWILETKLCEWRKDVYTSGESRVQIAGKEEELHLQLLEQLLLVVLIIGRWLLPKGDISREQLSQILLAYLAISSDIVEFFDVFKERAVFSSTNIQYMVLAAWTLSLCQFPFVLTVSRARKMRVAITKTYEELIMPRRRKPDIWQLFYDLDLWAILLANSLQDIPFLLVRLYLMFERGLITYTMLFFTCKNALIIALQTYRAFILINDRYIHPKPPDLENPMHHHHHTKQRQQRKKKRERKEYAEERERLCVREDREEEKRERDAEEGRPKRKEKPKEKDSRDRRARSNSRSSQTNFQIKEETRERRNSRGRRHSNSADRYHRVH